jgi:hypothetical protein
LQQTVARLDSLHRRPVEPSVGKIIDGDVRITTSEEELIETLADLRATLVKPANEKIDIVLAYVEQLLRDGELKFTRSQTRAVKGPRT